MKRPEKKPAGIGSGANLDAATDADFLTRWPNLYERLTDQRWEDGRGRVTDALTVSVADGGVKVGLKDRDAGMILFVTGSSIYGALDAIEEDLANESAQWRRDNFDPRWKKGKGG